MKFKPHDYQAFAANFIHTHPHAALLLDMGLGKTAITLTALNDLIYDTFQVRRALVIAPLKVARDTWPDELEKWDHLAGLRFARIIGIPKQRRDAIRQDAEVYLINRENLAWLVKELWPDWPYDMVIIDELSSFKDHNTKKYKALAKVLPKTNRVVGLTGTPAPKGLLDLWAQFKLIDGGQRLGHFITGYRDRYFLPDKRNGHQVFSWKLKPGADEEIYAAIDDITISMRAADYLNMPKLHHVDHTVHLDPPEAAKYQQLKRDMVLELETGETIDAVTAAALSNKLLQMSSGAVYTDQPDGSYTAIHDQKIDALADIVEQANGQNVLVCFWFKHELPRIKARLPQARHLVTREDFAAWNRGDIPIGLIHPQSAGHGLNLQTGGHIMVWLTLPWSLELYEQANARLYRQGQDQPVTIVRIMCADSIDQHVAHALETKDLEQSALIDAVAAELKKGN